MRCSQACRRRAKLWSKYIYIKVIRIENANLSCLQIHKAAPQPVGQLMCQLRTLTRVITAAFERLLWVLEIHGSVGRFRDRRMVLHQSTVAHSVTCDANVGATYAVRDGSEEASDEGEKESVPDPVEPPPFGGMARESIIVSCLQGRRNPEQFTEAAPIGEAWVRRRLWRQCMNV